MPQVHGPSDEQSRISEIEKERTYGIAPWLESAMKMEHTLRATKAATVKATPAKAGDSLAVDQVIVEFE